MSDVHTIRIYSKTKASLAECKRKHSLGEKRPITYDEMIRELINFWNEEK